MIGRQLNGGFTFASSWTAYVSAEPINMSLQCLGLSDPPFKRVLGQRQNYSSGNCLEGILPSVLRFHYSFIAEMVTVGEYIVDDLLAILTKANLVHLTTSNQNYPISWLTNLDNHIVWGVLPLLELVSQGG